MNLVICLFQQVQQVHETFRDRTVSRVLQKENSEHNGPTRENDTQLKYAQRNQVAEKQRKTGVKRMMKKKTTTQMKRKMM